MNASTPRATLFFKEAPHALPPSQGFAVFEDRAFILHHTGMCCVYDLKARDGAPLAVFPLGSYNAGSPTKDYTNHSNSCMFGKEHYNGNPIPLLYVVIGAGIGYDEDGYFYRCAVENITRNETDGKETYQAQTLQVISYHPEGIEDTDFLPPCWGCPAFFADTEHRALYMFSAKYRTKRGTLPEGERENTYLITKFDLPSLDQGALVRLTPRDIRDQFTVCSDILFTQGGALADQKIYYTFGCPMSKEKYPNEIAVFDLNARTMCARISDLDEALHMEEIESCEFYNGELLCNTSAGSVFVIDKKLLS